MKIMSFIVFNNLVLFYYEGQMVLKLLIYYDYS